jgi:hypothetical protein
MPLRFKQYLQEDSAPENKWGYNLLQWGCIKLWGGVLYLDYPHLPRGPGNLSFVENAFRDLARDVKEGNDEEVDDFNEWAQEGMKTKGNKAPNLTKELYDKIMRTAERETTKPLTLHREGKIFDNGWTSTSLTSRKAGVGDSGTEQHTFEIPVGTKVIFADGIADKDEVIVDSAILKALK